MNMSTPQSSSRGLNWSGGLAALGVAALLAFYSWAQAQPPAEKPTSGSLVNVFAQIEAPELEKAKSELDKLQADLEKKKAELEAAKARLKEAQKARATKTATTARAARTATTSHVIRIEVSGLDEKPEAIKELVKKLEKAVSGDGHKVTVTVAADADAGGLRVWGLAPNPVSGVSTIRAPGKPAEVLVQPAPGIPAARGLGFGGGQSRPDPRVEKLEKKLDALLEELESLRKEMKGPGGKGSGGGGGAGYGPAKP